MKFAVLFCALVALSTSAQAIYVNNGFVSGNDYRTKMSTDDQEAYVVGVISGLLAAPMLGGDEGKANKLSACTSKMGGQQINAIVKKWVELNPERWHTGMNMSIYSAIKQACGL